MTVTRLALVGDSLTQGTGPSGTPSAYAQGRSGTWAERARDALANLSGVGPLISPGLRPCWYALLAGESSGEWAVTGSWNVTVSTDAFDKAPYGLAYAGSDAAEILTYTVPNWMPTWHGFAVDWIDRTSGGTWSYRINAGSWTAIPNTPAADNLYKRFYVTAAIVRGDTIQFRGATAAGTDCIALPVGIRPFFLAPSTTQGLIVDNYGANGQQLHSLVLATSGDRMAAFDTVTLGSGSPSVSTPTHVLMGHLNDVTRASTTEWNTDLGTLRNRMVAAGATVGFWSPWEVSTAIYNQTQQTNYRAQTKTSAAAFSPAVSVLDIYDTWGALGYTANAGAAAAGFLAADAVHESTAGMTDLWPRFYWFVRNRLLGIGNAPTSYPVAGKQAAVQYQGKLAAVQYAAGAPVSV